jgi:adenine phosphoribosyltransferase
VFDVCRNLNPNLRALWHSEFDYIGVVESRGYIVGSMLAHELNKGLVLLRSKPNRLPGDTSVVYHTLEYGDARMEVQNGKGKVLVVDDVLATGGTMRGAIEVLTKAGYTPTASLFLVELTQFKPDLNIPFASIIKY